MRFVTAFAARTATYKAPVKNFIHMDERLRNSFLYKRAIWCIVEISQIMTSGRIAYDPEQKRIYVDRVVGRDSDYCVTDGHIDAGSEQGP